MQLDDQSTTDDAQTATPRPPGPPLLADPHLAFRTFRSIDEDVPGMAAANQRLRTDLGLVEAVTVPAMLHSYRHLVNSDPIVDCIVLERGGVTAGYARVEWHNLTDGDRIYDMTLAIEPDARGAGVAAAAVTWCEARLRQVAAAHPTDRREWFAAWVFDGDSETSDALLERGYEPVRWDAEMLRATLDDLADPGVPAGYTIRPPEPAELPAVHAMAVEAFAEHWGEWEADEQSFEEWVEDPDFRRDLVVVAWTRDGRPAAYVTNELETRPDGSLRGLLDGVATHPHHRRRGLARACIAESLRRLRAEGATSAYLGVDTDNHNRALDLYESSGFRVVSGATTYRRPFARTP